MVRIRLRRIGLKKQPSYRVVVINQQASRGGGYIEAIGHYNPRTQPATIDLQEDRALYWLSVGAQPSESVEQLFRTSGTAERFARLRKGETLEDIVAEWNANKPALPSTKTRYPSPAAGQSYQKAKEAKQQE